MSRTIAVRAASFGWSLHIDEQSEALLFATGGKAEAMARKVARHLAEAGETTDIAIYLRDGSLAGLLRSTPQTPVARPRGGPRVPVESAAAA
jgi:hypothetical protein